MSLRPLVLGFALVVPAVTPVAASAGLECVIHEWAVSPGQWTGSGDTDPTPLLMTATTRWEFELADCSLASGACNVFGSGSRTFQNGAERPEWYPTDTQPTISNPGGNSVVYDFSMRDAFVPIQGQPRFEDMDWTLTAVLPVPPSDSPSAAELAAAISIDVAITHWVDNTFFEISWSGTANDTVFTSCTTPLAQLSVDDVTQAEGSGGGDASFVFTVGRDHNEDAVSVVVATSDGTASAGSDYTAVGPLVLDFPAGGALTQDVVVTVAGDDQVELDEGFTVELSSPTNALIVDGTGDGTVANDDSASLSIDSVSQGEGSGGGSVPYAFAVTLDGLVDTTVFVDFDTLDGTAEDEAGDGDYGSANGTLEFPRTSRAFAGPRRIEMVTVDVVADDRPEQDESFLVALSNVFADGRDVSIDIAQGVATVIDDDDACPALAIYRQPFDSPASVAGHFATTGGGATFENVVDGSGDITTLPPGPISRVRLWGFGDHGAGPCPLDPAVPFHLVFSVDAAGVPGAVVAQRSNITGRLAAGGGGVTRIDLDFEPLEAGDVSWISVARDESGGCSFLWLAEPLRSSYDDQVFTSPRMAPDDAYLCVGHPWLFGDGFESGDTSGWSNTVP